MPMTSPTAITVPVPAARPAVPGRPALRVGPASVVWRPRTVVVLTVTAVVLLLGVALNVGRGEYPIGVGEVLAVLAGGGDAGQQFIVLELRLPRSLTGALVGAALAVSGALTQTVARNPLASPDVIGFTAGASAAAVFVIVLGGGFGTLGGLLAAAGVPLAALAGSLATAFAIYGLAWRDGVQGFRLVLIGIGINAMPSTSSRAGSGSGRGSPWRWRRAPTCSCSTSPPRSSTSPTRSTSWSSCAGCPPRPGVRS